MSSKYAELSQDAGIDESEAFLREDSKSEASNRRPRARLFWALNVGILCLSSILLLQSWLLRRPEPKQDCMASTSMWSPALSSFNGRYKEVRFMGTLGGYSPYKGPPNENVEAAWDKIVELPAVRIDRDTLERINPPNLDSAIKLPEEVGGGYLAATEAQHQLHCLYMLWQHSQIDYYGPRVSTWKDSPQRIRQHLDHCADLLRQKLMCEADAGLVTYNWIANYSKPFPNFNVLHKCRANWDDLTKWNWDHAAQLPESGYYEPDEDAIILDYEP